MDLNELLLWISENISLAYRSKEEIARAYYWISRADQMISRARKRNEYRFYYYASLLLSAGVSASGHSAGYVKFRRPSKIMKLFATKHKRQMCRKISRKIARECHTSERTAAREYLPFLRFFVDKNRDLLDEKEISFLKTVR